MKSKTEVLLGACYVSVFAHKIAGFSSNDLREVYSESDTCDHGKTWKCQECDNLRTKSQIIKDFCVENNLPYLEVKVNE